MEKQNIWLHPGTVTLRLGERKNEGEIPVLSDETILEQLPECVRTPALAKIILNICMGSFLSISEYLADVKVDSEVPTDIPEETKKFLLSEMLASDCDEQFSIRNYNCLHAVGVVWYYQAAMYSEHELLKLRNFGTKSLFEINERLALNGVTAGIKAVLQAKDERIRDLQIKEVDILIGSSVWLEYFELVKSVDPLVADVSLEKFLQYMRNKFPWRGGHTTNLTLYEETFSTEEKKDQVVTAHSKCYKLINNLIHSEMVRFIKKM